MSTGKLLKAFIEQREGDILIQTIGSTLVLHRTLYTDGTHNELHSLSMLNSDGKLYKMYDIGRGYTLANAMYYYAHEVNITANTQFRVTYMNYPNKDVRRVHNQRPYKQFCRRLVKELYNQGIVPVSCYNN